MGSQGRFYWILFFFLIIYSSQGVLAPGSALIALWTGSFSVDFNFLIAKMGRLRWGILFVLSSGECHVNKKFKSESLFYKLSYNVHDINIVTTGVKVSFVIDVIPPMWYWPVSPLISISGASRGCRKISKFNTDCLWLVLRFSPTPFYLVNLGSGG